MHCKFRFFINNQVIFLQVFKMIILTRILREYHEKSEGVVLSRSTLAEWVGRTGVALQPLVDRLTWYLLQGNTLHIDETRAMIISGVWQ